MDYNDNGRDLPVPITRLYISHFLSAWNIRLIEFGSVLFISQIYPSTLLPASVYALIRAFAAIVFSSAVGTLVDRLNRLQTIRLSIGVQRISTAATCGLLFALAGKPEIASLERSMMALLYVFASLEKLAATLNTISVERDWVVVLSSGSEVLLQRMNSQMRRIDLFCKLVAPLCVALVAGFSLKLAVLVTLALSAFSLPLEYILISMVYHRTQQLQFSPTASSINNESTRHRTTLSNMTEGFHKAWSDIWYYCTHSAFLPSLSLSLLYLTVFSFGGQMISYLGSLSYSSTPIGLLRTASAICELSATFIAPLVMRRIGVIRCGIRSLNAQLFCISIATAMLWAPTNIGVTTPIFLLAIMLSRTGLWSFDLSAQILIQEGVESEGRGRFSAIEAAVQNAFELLSYASTIVWANPNQYRYPATITMAAVACATLTFSIYTKQKRGHLFHVPACMDCHKAPGTKSRRAGWTAVPQHEGELVSQNLELADT
ncbi:hypothetical protein K461DRAFT_230750 [Myriangium duriaei CBS 260.36]|uniref:Solute carrier family 40 member n=1 Tax=Myriangium duriaei CBS 260.36 TaxID=1168546 RepID=A0A9P4IW10_9PEZI|nr:hypothetical protein K461DRAFT_230750 [Myriangium duriaei CBS 260.36]